MLQMYHNQTVEYSGAELHTNRTLLLNLLISHTLVECLHAYVSYLCHVVIIRVYLFPRCYYEFKLRNFI